MAGEIRTGRLLLRPPRLEDFADLARICADPAMWRHPPRGPMDGEESHALLLRLAGHHALAGWGQYLMFEQESGALVGYAGLARAERGIGEDYDPFPEIGWTVAPPFRGRGYAREAATAALAEADARWARTVCLVHAANAPSLRVAEALGYRRLRDAVYKDAPAIVFERFAAAR